MGKGVITILRFRVLSWLPGLSTHAAPVPLTTILHKFFASYSGIPYEICT